MDLPILPPEIIEIILKKADELNLQEHKFKMKDVFNQILYCVTWIRCENEYSFIISNTPNIYALLECIDDDFCKVSKLIFKH